MSLVHWPESELSEDISEQLDVNEVKEASEKHSNDGQNADESATGQAEPSLPADVLWGSFVTHSGRNECVTNETPKDVCGEAKQSHQAKGKKLTSQLLRTNFFLASRRRQIHRKLQARR